MGLISLTQFPSKGCSIKCVVGGGGGGTEGFLKGGGGKF